MRVSARLAMWAGAAVAGRASFDDALDHVTARGVHVVVGLDRLGEAQRRAATDAAAVAGHRVGSDAATTTPLSASLIRWRLDRAPVRLALPVAGDVRGAPTSRAFLAAAIDAGEGVFGGGLGLVPAPAAADGAAVRWTAYAVDEPTPDALQLNEAEHELARAMRETATLLAEAQVGGTRGVDPGELARMRRTGEDFRFTPGFDPRAAALVTQAERLDAMLQLALRDSIGGAIDRDGISVRAQALIRLHTVVRRARLAGYNSGYRGQTG